MIVTFLPAAGRSARMGGSNKLLECVDDEPLLRRMARRAAEAKLGPVLVGLRSGDQVRREALDGLDVRVVEVADAHLGMSATLRAGARAALSEIDAGYETCGNYEYFGMIVMLPDMPEIEAADLVALDRAFHARGGPVVRATSEDGEPGHPVLFPDSVVREFDRLDGDRGAATLLEDERIVLVPLSGDRAITDLDTPEDWALWRTGLRPSSS